MSAIFTSSFNIIFWFLACLLVLDDAFSLQFWNIYQQFTWVSYMYHIFVFLIIIRAHFCRIVYNLYGLAKIVFIRWLWEGRQGSDSLWSGSFEILGSYCHHQLPCECDYPFHYIVLFVWLWINYFYNFLDSTTKYIIVSYFF